jgi:two-component system OmpR family response regulator
VASPVRAVVVHEDPAIRTAIAEALRADGLDAAEAATAAAAERAIAELEPRVVILDVARTDRDGFELAGRLAEGGRASAVIFVTDPWDVQGILARAQAVLRRTGGEDGVLRFADVVLDENGHEVRRSGEPVDLTPTEFNLLRYFLLNPRRILSKAQILENVWGDARVEPSEVETYVSYLRRKLHRNGPPLIRTVRSAGYVLREGEG